MAGRKRKFPPDYFPAKWPTSSSESDYDVPLSVPLHRRYVVSNTDESDTLVDQGISWGSTF